MELPTYTNIWKIEKRLYKLYDFRLPMPLPVGQVAAFLAIAAPYTLILTMVGMPFSHTWLWLYVLPPGALAWLVTRPVLEGKRLPELVLSQVRYLSEPRTWCRLAPLNEKDEIVVVATVWREPARARPAPPAATLTVPASAPVATAPVPVVADSVAGVAASARPAWPDQPLLGSAAEAHVSAAAVQLEALAAELSAPEAQAAQARAEQAQAAQAPADERQRARAESGPVRSGPRPVLTVKGGTPARPLHVVERALRNPPGPRADSWHEPVLVVRGGHRPGKPDQLQRDQARARLPLPGPARIVVLGCTVGAGQTTATLLIGQLLASLRGEAVAVLDLSPGQGSLTERARAIPRLLPSLRGGDRPIGFAGGADGQASDRERGLQVVTADRQADQPEDAGELIEALVARYPLALADPAALHVPRSLHVADQLVLVAPASAEAAGALAMTLEWLDAHGHSGLARTAVVVLNGVSTQTTPHVDKAAVVASGRCRAIVRVSWDGALASDSSLGPAVVQAYTALAGLLVSGLADPAISRGARR